MDEPDWTLPHVAAHRHSIRQGGVPGAPADARGGACFVRWMFIKPERICAAGKGVALDDLSPAERSVW